MHGSVSQDLVGVQLEEGWAQITLNRPNKRNALSGELIAELIAALDGVAATGRKVVVLAAKGPVFCAGGDISEPRPQPGEQSNTTILLEYLRSTPLFLIARVQGDCYGAAVALVAVCPIAIATSMASFALPETSLGHFAKPVSFLESIIPKRRLLEMSLMGSWLNAGDAALFGLLTAAVPRSGLDTEVQRWVAMALQRPVVADQSRRYWLDSFADPSFSTREAWFDELVGH
jgi:enoyl-CoA hydratase